VRKYLEPAAGVVLAVVVYAVLGRLSPVLVLVLNPFAWVVIYFGLTRQEAFGAVAGSVCGLLQDSLSLGVFGVGGLSKTLMGFAAGYVSRKINVAPVLRNLVFVFILALGELAIWKGLVFFLFGNRPTTGHGWALLQPVATALAVVVFVRLRNRVRKGGA
jgi:rod shape-determining protein MreD